MMIAGRIMILPKGDWNADTTYKMLDLVLYEGKSWLAKKTNVNTIPSADNSVYWQLFTDIPDLTDEQASMAVDKYLQIGHIVTTNETAEGIEYTITSINGTDTVLIRHGAKGDKGDAGGVLIGTLEHLEHLGELKIYHVTKEEYEAVLASDNFDDNALYITPDEEYATPDDVTEAIKSALENAKETGMFFSEKDVIITMVEAGLLNVLLDEEGNILTDENGNVLLDETKRYVASVNGVKPDEDGNVEVVVDWNTMINKPFETKETREVWIEETIEGNSFNNEAYFGSLEKSLYKISGKNLIVTIDGVEYKTSCNEFEIICGEYTLSHHPTNDYGSMSPTISGETYDIKIEVIDSAIPDSVIPDSIARLDDIPEVTPHDWKTMINKPFGETMSGTLIASMDFDDYWDMDDTGETFASCHYEELNIVNGTTYTVVWDGSVYACKAFYYSNDVDGYCALGNASLKDSSLEDTGEPFFMYYTVEVEDGEVWDYEGIIYTSDTVNKRHIIELYEGGITIKQLPNKYLAPIEIIGGDTLTWDGDTSSTAPSGEEAITDITPTISDLANGGKITLNVDGQETEYTFDSSNVSGTDDCFTITVNDIGAVIVYSDEIMMQYMGIENGGCTCFYWNSTTSTYVSSLTINGYTGFTTEKLKEEYLPDTVPTNTETWTFTLEDGSTVTKEVYVK